MTRSVQSQKKLSKTNANAATEQPQNGTIAEISRCKHTVGSGYGGIQIDLPMPIERGILEIIMKINNKVVYK